MRIAALLAANCVFPLRVTKTLRTALLSATALVSVSTVGWAEDIDNGATEIVDGGGIDSTQASPWNVGGLLFIGEQGRGDLLVRNGGTVSNIFGIIGNRSGSTGAVTVTGAGSRWENSFDVAVGNSGIGALTIAEGGIVSNTEGSIGRGSGSNGAVTVTGSDARWENSADLNVGDSGTGALTIAEGGTVRNEIGFIGHQSGSNGAVTVTGAGSSWQNSDALAVGLGGTAALTIAGGGTVRNVTSSIGVSGGSNGTVMVTGAGSSWQNSDALTVGNSGTGALTIADGGAVVANGGVEIARNGSSTGTLNIGAADGETAVTAGVLNAASVAFGAGTGAVVFNHTDTDYAFDPIISGAGTVSVLSGTTVFNGAHSYSGGTDIIGGQLTVNGSTTGATTVAGSGTLGGSGKIGAVTVGNGGTLAPGNSIGTITADSITFDAGSRYAVEVNAAGNSDLLDASGAVTINAGVTLDVTSENGSTYRLSTDYTIITADGGVTGMFDTVTDSFAFLDTDVRYDPNDVYLRLTRNNTAFADFVQTPNQIATAGGVNSLGAGSAVYDAVLMLEEADVAAAFDALSGEAHASVKAGLIQTGTVIVDKILGSARRVRDDQPTPAVTRGAFAAMPQRGTWGTVFASRVDTKDTTNTAAIKQTIGGTLAGVDLFVSSELQFGVTLGVSGSEYDVADLRSSGTMTSAHLGFYSNVKSGPLDIQVGAAYSHHEIESDRVVTSGANTDQLSASYNAQSMSFFTEVSRDFGPVTPFANASYVMLDTDGFTERGGAAALTVEGSSQEVAFASLGVRADHRFAIAGGEARLSGSAAWLHATGDLASEMGAAFDGGATFNIEGVPIAADAAMITAAIDFDMGRGTSVGFGYAGQLSENAQSHSIQARLTKSF